jgi:hypothetical protein
MVIANSNTVSTPRQVKDRHLSVLRFLLELSHRVINQMGRRSHAGYGQDQNRWMLTAFQPPTYEWIHRGPDERGDGPPQHATAANSPRNAIRSYINTSTLKESQSAMARHAREHLHRLSTQAARPGPPGHLDRALFPTQLHLLHNRTSRPIFVSAAPRSSPIHRSPPPVANPRRPTSSPSRNGRIQIPDSKNIL